MQMQHFSPLLIVGASVRAAAGSARRAGLPVVAADLFNDADLVDLCDRTWLVTDYPAGFATPIGEFAGPWVYTGGLENHPAWVDRFARLATLWGNQAAALQAVRHPLQLARVLRTAGFRFPATFCGSLLQDQVLQQSEPDAAARTAETPLESTASQARSPQPSPAARNPVQTPEHSAGSKQNAASSAQAAYPHTNAANPNAAHAKAAPTNAAHAATAAGLGAAYRPDGDEMVLGKRERTSRWLRKPLASAGGQGVHAVEVDAAQAARWLAATKFDEGLPEHTVGTERPNEWLRGDVLQQFVPGSSRSACYVAAEGRAYLIGVTRQLVGCRWAGANGFQYVGSIGPLPLRPDVRRQWERLGCLLADTFGLCGLFGVDAVVDRVGITPIEVNPRYPASLEILERGLGVHALPWHLAACRGEPLEWDAEPLRREPAGCFGKAILYAPRDFLMPAELANRARQAARRTSWPTIADIPHAGSAIQTGHPVWTIFATGSHVADVARKLRSAATDWHALWNSLPHP